MKSYVRNERKRKDSMKKGILESNVFSMIIVAAGIVLFFIFVVNKIYGKTDRAVEENNPRVFIEKVAGLVENVEAGQSVEKKVLGFDRVDEPTWFLVAYGKDDVGAPENKQCILSSCVCVCEVECELNAVCRKVSVERLELSNYLIGQTSPQFTGGMGGIGVIDPVVMVEHKLFLPSLLIEITISKDKDGAKILSYSKEYELQYGKNEPTG